MSGSQHWFLQGCWRLGQPRLADELAQVKAQQRLGPLGPSGSEAGRGWSQPCCRAKPPFTITLRWWAGCIFLDMSVTASADPSLPLRPVTGVVQVRSARGADFPGMLLDALAVTVPRLRRGGARWLLWRSPGIWLLLRVPEPAAESKGPEEGVRMKKR